MRATAGQGRGLWRLFGLAFFMALAHAPTPSQASGEVQDTVARVREMHPVAREAISKIRSPYCPGLMLEVCPTREAQALRDSIHQGARAGVSADSLLERVVRAHGEEYRAFPKRSGAGLLAWLMPPLALLAGLGVVVVALRRLLGPGVKGEAAAGLSDEDRGRLDRALEQFDALEESQT